MKQAQRKDFFREIKRSLNRYLSILFIVALGTAFYAGIRSSEPDMRLSADAYFDQSRLMDIRVIGTLGISEENVAAVSAIDGIGEAEGGYFLDCLSESKGIAYTLQVFSLCENMNRMTVKEGRLPEKADECFLDEALMKDMGLSVGGRITLRSGTEDAIEESLDRNFFTIVGSGTYSWFLNMDRGTTSVGDGNLDGFMAVLPEVFKTRYYTVVYARTEGPDMVSYTEDYQEQTDRIAGRIEEIAGRQCEIHFADIRKEAGDRIDEGTKELADAEQEAEEKLAEGAKEIEDARKELEEGKEKLEDARVRLADGKKEVEDGKRELADAKTELTEKEEKLREAKEELPEAEQKLADAGKELEEGWQEFAAGVARWEEGRQQTDAGWREYQNGASELEKAEELLKAKEAELEQAELLLQGQEAQLQEQEAELRQAQEQLDTEKVRLEQGEAVLAGQKAELEQQIAELSTAAVPDEAALEELRQQLELLVNSPQAVELAEARKRLTAAQEQLAAGQAELEAARKQLETAKEQTAKGREQLASGMQEIDANRKKLEDGKKRLEDAEKELADNWTSIGVAAWTLEHGEKELADGKQKLEDAKEEIVEGEQKIAEGWAAVAENEQKLTDAEKELPDAEAKIAQARTEIADGERKLADGEKEYEDGKREAEDKLGEAREKLADARKTLNELEEPEWFVLDRNSIQSYVEYGMDAERIGAIGRVFPAIFFMVAALVSLTTMTRMVEEERTLIGTMKALGYGKWSIASKYILYALSASLLGSFLGVTVGSRLLPWVIISAYGMLYNNLQIMVTPVDFGLSLMATAIATACTTLAAFAACYKELRSEPAQLMRPAAPVKGKRVFLEYLPFIWKRMTFTGKSAIRNLFRYKKRFLMTIFGIASCMALLMVGYGLRDSIQNIVDNQYQTLWIYDAELSIDEDETPEAQKEGLARLREAVPEIGPALFARVTMLDVGKEGLEKSAYIFVPQTAEELDQFVTLRDRKSGVRYDLTDEGVIISEKLSKLLGVGVGDEICLKENETDRYPVKITAISENYLAHYVYLTPSLYERVFGRTPDYNHLYLRLPEMTKETETFWSEQLLKDSMVESVRLAGELQRTIQDMLKSLDMVIWVLIISAGLLAFVVLYNLNNINITERRRELATLKVLGFYDGEVAAYVYRENVYLTAIGIAAGAALGIILHRYVILTCEIDLMMFGRTIRPMSYLYSTAITICFSVSVNIIMFFRLRKIDMVESLKSVE